MRKYLGYLCPAVLAAAMLQPAVAQEGSPPPRALLIADLGAGHEAVSGAMEAHGWITGSVQWVDLLQTDAQDLRTQWDVIWLLPGSDYQGLQRLARAGGPLAGFVEAGGVVIMTGVSTGKSRIDVAVGGVDVMKRENVGAITITVPDHPLILRASHDGADLSVNELDPGATGGGGVIRAPATGCTLTSIASNDAGPVLGEYTLGQGHVVVSLLDLLNDACLNNLLLYAQSLAQAS